MCTRAPLGHSGSGTRVVAYSFDTRYGKTPPGPSTFELDRRVMNVTAAEISGIELPNCAHVFREGDSVRLSLSTGGVATSVSVPPGNYCSESLVAALDASLRPLDMSASMDVPTGRIVVRGRAPFRIDPSAGKGTLSSSLGFSQGTPYASVATSGAHEVSGSGAVDATGQRCALLGVTLDDTEMRGIGQVISSKGAVVWAAAKVTLDQPRGSVVFVNGGSCMSMSSHFHPSIGVSKVTARLMDLDGNPLDTNGCDYSFTLELTHTIDSRLHEEMAAPLSRGRLWN